MTTIAAVLWLVASSGFWPGPHWQGFVYPDLASCELGRLAVEMQAQALGYRDVRATCTEVKDRTT